MNNRGTILQHGLKAERIQLLHRMNLGFLLAQLDEQGTLQHFWCSDGRKKGGVPLAPNLLSFGMPFKNCENQFFNTASGSPSGINSYYLPKGSVLHRVFFSASRVQNAEIKIFINDTELCSFTADDKIKDIREDIQIEEGGIVKIVLCSGVIDYGEILLLVSVDHRSGNEN